MLVFDCETTVDDVQSLLFGAYRYYRLDWAPAGPSLSCVEEGLFYADELPATNPEDFACLEEYAHTHLPVVAAGVDDAVHSLALVSRAELCEQVLSPALSARATAVGFNLPFDLSRLTVKAGEARDEFAGGFTLYLSTYEKDGVAHSDPWWPSVRIRSFDANRARIQLSGTIPSDDSSVALRRQGEFLDLRTLSYALTGNSLSLEDACEIFGVLYRKRAVEHGQITPECVDYCREDVAATAELYRALAHEYERW